MKKTFALLLSVILVCMMATSIFAAFPDTYPGSPDWDYPLPTSGQLITGEILGYERGWASGITAEDPNLDNPIGDPAVGPAAAFDGDTMTYFDPAVASTDPFYCGIKADQQYVLTEIRICSRNGQDARFNGATIQGSNDGVEWTDIWDNYIEAAGQDYFCVTPEDPTNDGKCEGEWYTSDPFQYFRYFNPANHGDVAEVELYGNPVGGAAAPAAPATAGFASLDEAAASIGKTPLADKVAEFVDGSAGNANEGPEALWDNDTATKFCTATFPTISIVKLDGAYSIDGIIMATANDNADYNDRSPFEWTISGSNDGENWTPIATGDDTFFEEVNFTYFAKAVDASPAYEYIQFYSEGAISGCFQVSEVVVCGTAAAAAPAETPAEVETPAPAPAPAPTAPATGDMFVILAVVASVALAAVVVLKKVTVK